MTVTSPQDAGLGHLLSLSAALTGAQTAEAAVSRTIELIETLFEQPVASVCEHDTEADTLTPIGPSVQSLSQRPSALDCISESAVAELGERGDDQRANSSPEVVVDTDPEGPFDADVLVPVGRDRALYVGVPDPDGFDDSAVAAIEGIGANLESALARIDRRQSATVDCPIARALFEQSDDATFVSDTDGRLVAVNRAGVELTGSDRDALLRNELCDIFPQNAAETACKHPDSGVTEASKPRTTTLTRADETDRRVELTSQPVDVAGTKYVRTTARPLSGSSGAQAELRRTEDPVETDTTALRRLNELTVGTGDFEDTVERLLSLGCDHFGLDTGILSHIEGETYEIEAVVDATETHEAGAVYDLGDTMCQTIVAGEAPEPLAFADIAETDHQSHPAATGVSAYVAAPVTVDGETYGTVNFSMESPRSEAFRPEEEEFVKLIAQWVGTEIERRCRFEELERYETILEALDDPVYALDTEGQFTFVNTAAKREFGYGPEILGQDPSIGMDEQDILRVRRQIDELTQTDERSKTATFELRTADDSRKIVENRIALIGDDEFRGTAGVLRDITARKEREQQLESFQQAIDQAADGIAILDDEEYVFIDQSHIDMYGFDDKEQLLGNTWRMLYDDDEVERLEAEVFPTLEAEGHWRGMVTGSRPDGSTFPAELSLTIIDDGRLVCAVRDETTRKKRERELESFQQAIESARDGVAVIDDSDEYVYVDQSHVDMYGFDDKEQLLGNTWQMLYNDDEVERLEAEAMPALEAEGYWRGMVTGSRPDGSTFPAELSLTIVEDGRLVCTVRDETERQARQRELELKEQAMNEASVGIQITDPSQAENPLVYVNDGFEQLTGYTREEALGRNPRFLQGEDTDPEKVARLRDAISAEEPVSLELRNVRKNGTPYWTRISLTPVTDESGALKNFIGIQQDVTERRRRERQITARKEFLTRIYEVTTDPELSFKEKITGLLEAGRDHLDLPYGFLTRIETDPKEGAGTQTIVEALGSHALLQPGNTAPLDQSYCRKTIAQDDPKTVTHAAESKLADDPAYETFGLETYIGDDVIAGENLYGTLCFASEEPNEEAFDEFEQSFVSLVARWAGYEIDRQNANEELREQGERLELTLSGTDTGMAEWDLRTDAMTWNETLIDITDLEIDSIEEFKTAVHPDDRHRVQHALETMVETGDPWTGEFRMIGEDGDTQWIGTRATVVYDGEQEPTRVLAIGTDISERKNEQRERRRNERRFESLFDDPEMLVGLLDTDGRVVDVNETAMSYVDATLEELRGDLFFETPWWSHSEALSADIQKRMQRAADGEYVEYTATHPGPDGSQRDVTGVVRPVTDKSGAVQSLLITGQDVTERKQSQRELQRRQRKLDLVLSNTDTSIVELDFENGVLNWDDMSGDNAIGSPEAFDAFLETVSPEDQERLQSDIETMRRSGELLTGEYRLVNEAGETVWVAARAVPVDAEGEQSTSTERAVAIASDITELKKREQKLFEERERLRLLTERLEEYAFITVGEDGDIQTWNEGAKNMFGYDAEAAIGMSMAELHPKSDRESGLPERLLQQARVAGDSGHDGWRVDADGSEFYADGRYASLVADDGEFLGYAMVIRDMTDRRRQRRRTEQFVEESDNVVTIVDTDGTISYTSGSADRVLGYRADDLLGENLFDFLHSDSREHTMKTFFDAVERSTKAKDECRFESPDGDWLNVEARFRDMTEDEAIDGVLVYLRDVTENTKQARRFESIFNGTFQFTGLLETDGTVIEANDAFLEFGGFTGDAIIGESFSDAPWWDHSKTSRRNVRDAIERAANGEFVRYETKARGADGLATLDFSVKPVTDQDGDVSLLVVEGRDITDQQRHRRHLEVMQRVMRHNMRNDLTKMRGWTQMMCEEPDAKKRADHFDTIESVFDKWESMTEEIKNIRNILQTQQAKQTRTAVQSLIEDAVAPVREEYADATVVTDVSDAGSTQIPATLLDAIRELAENAAQVSPEVTVEVTPSRLADGWLEIGVRDDGPGMPEMEANVLENGEETPLNHGQGLGLWMVRMIVTQAGGEVTVEPTADGTEVRLRLPSKQVPGAGGLDEITE